MNRFQLHTSLFLFLAAIFICAGILAPNTTVLAGCLPENADCGGVILEECCKEPTELTCYSPTGDPNAFDWKCIPTAEAETAASTTPNLIDWTITGIKNIWGGIVTGVANVASGWLDDKVEKLVNWFIHILASVMNAIATLEVFFIVAFAHPALFKFATAPFVHTGWYVSLQLANLLLVLGLIYLANKFILGQEKFGDYSKLIKYITYAVFINFSLSIASFFIGISNYLTLAFLNLGGASTDTHISSTPPTVWDIAVNFGNRLAGVFESLASLNDAGNASAISSIANGLVLVLFSIMLVIILGAIAFGFIRRVITLWLLMMIMPLAYVLDIVGVNIGGKIGPGASKLWQDSFMKQLTFGPIMAFGLWFVLLIMARVGEAYTNIETGGEFTDTFQSIQHIIQPIVFIVILVFAFTQASSIAGGAGKGFDKAMGWAQNLPQKAGEKIGKWTKEGAQYMGAQAGKKITGTKAGESFIAANAGKRGLGGKLAGAFQKWGDSSSKILSGRADQYTGAVNSMSKEKLLDAANDTARTEPFRAAAFARLQEKHSDFLAYQPGVDEAKIKNMEKLAKKYGKKFEADDVFKYRPSLLGAGNEAKQRDLIQSLSTRDLGKVQTSELLTLGLNKNLSANQVAHLLSTKETSAEYTAAQQQQLIGALQTHNGPAITDLGVGQAVDILIKLQSNPSKILFMNALKACKDPESRTKISKNAAAAAIIAFHYPGGIPAFIT